jgi:UPF0755 protein
MNSNNLDLSTDKQVGAANRQKAGNDSDEELASLQVDGELNEILSDEGDKKTAKNILWKLFFVGLVISVAFFIFFWAEFYLPQNNLNEITNFNIEKGASVKLVSQKLVEDGLIQSSLAFRFYFFVNRSAKVMAGTYRIAPKLSLIETIRFLTGTSGVSGGINVTFPEGLSLAQTKNILLEKNFKANELDKLHIAQFSKNFDFLKDAPQSATLEGFLFPDTYDFFAESTSSEIAQIMLSNFDKRFPVNVQKEIATQKRTVFQVITMASMLEKEAKTSADMQIISGILWKRLKMGMPLQVDATVAYALNKSGQELTREDFKYKSPYNTYLYSGLPKGPISNPGIRSILAAAFPRETNYLYYLSLPDGTIRYSVTLEEHNAAKYNLIKNK